MPCCSTRRWNAASLSARRIRSDYPDLRVVGFGIAGGAASLVACAESGRCRLCRLQRHGRRAGDRGPWRPARRAQLLAAGDRDDVRSARLACRRHDRKRRAAHPARTRGGGPGRRRIVQQGDRDRPPDRSGHGQESRPQHIGQAQGPPPRRDRRPNARAGAGAAAGSAPPRAWSSRGSRSVDPRPLEPRRQQVDDRAGR